MLDITKQGHRKIQKKAREFWFKVAMDYNDGLSAQEIAKKYINPRTGEPYTRQHIHWILKRISQGLSK